VLLLAIVDVKKSGSFVTELTCTQQLQTSHKPKGKFKGTPLKVSLMKKKAEAKNGKGTEKSVSPDENDEDKDRYYISRFINHVTSVGFNSTMPIKCINQPANPYAVVADHSYSCLSVVDSLIKYLKLEDITAEEIKEIERETRGQASNENWHDKIEGRLTASKCFHFVRGAEEAALAHNSLYPTRFVSKATNHGIKYEPVAVETYQV